MTQYKQRVDAVLSRNCLSKSNAVSRRVDIDLNLELTTVESTGIHEAFTIPSEFAQPSDDALSDFIPDSPEFGKRLVWGSLEVRRIVKRPIQPLGQARKDAGAALISPAANDDQIANRQPSEKLFFFGRCDEISMPTSLMTSTASGCTSGRGSVPALWMLNRSPASCRKNPSAI